MLFLCVPLSPCLIPADDSPFDYDVHFLAFAAQGQGAS
jgi:hypothetical protein